MPHSPRQRLSPWTARTAPPSRPPLARDLDADVCVVGAGVAGLTAAYLLAGEGLSVAVLEAREIAGGETGRSTAHLSNALDDRFSELERSFGEDGARLAGESHGTALARIGEIAAAEGIDCGYERLPGYLFSPSGRSPGGRSNGMDPELERELEAARRAGVAVERALRAPLAGFDTGPCLRFPGQAQVDPATYAAGLAAAVERRGGRIFGGTRAERADGGPTPRVETAAGPRVTCRALIVATNAPFHDPLFTSTQQGAYRTYAVAAEVPRGAVERALYWDTEDPYHYVRLGRGPRGELLIVGGEDHRTGQESDGEERFRRLEDWARERFPRMGTVAFRWSGQVQEPTDGLGLIGRHPNGVYVATGDSGQGMTHGTITGILLCDLIVGRDNAWARLYDPCRLSTVANREWVRENAETLARYGDWFARGEAGSAADVPPGCGAVVRRGLAAVAVHRDEQGAVTERSAVCPHLGCLVRWNPAEGTWDCPCHGSRFTAQGELLNGPAARGLGPA
jgi:glycine/D-amino acid oxidase-like deaminating enzyme/nitrite reductase/ring-hydroxylating ferredoxin subunit